MAEGFMGGLMEGFLSQVAPGYFNAMKQEEKEARANDTAKKQAEDIAKQTNMLIDPMLENVKDPVKRGILQSSKNMLMSQNTLLLEHPEKVMEMLIQHGLMATDPTDKIKEAEYSYNESLPENQRTMVFQRAMDERPADIQERQIKQQNADTLARNSGTAKQNADTNQFYRKNQVENPTIPKLGGSKQLVSNSNGAKLNTKDAQIISSFDTAQESINRIKELRKEGISVAGLEGVVQAYRSTGKPISAIADWALNSMGYDISPKQAELLAESEKANKFGMQALRGAGIGPKEEEMLIPSFPSKGQNETAFDVNTEVTEKNFRAYKERFMENKGIPIDGKNNKDDNSSIQGYQYSDSGKERYDPVNKIVEAKVGNKWVKIYENAILNDDGSISSGDKLDEEVAPDQITKKKIVKQAIGKDKKLYNLYDDGSEGLANE